MEFILLSLYVLGLLSFAGYSLTYYLDNGTVYIEKIILYGFSVLGLFALFFSTLGFSVSASFWYIIGILFIINIILIIRYKIRFVKLSNTSIEFVSIFLVLIIAAYPLIYFGTEFHSLYNFDFYFYSVVSDWLLSHDIANRALDHHTIMNLTIYASMRETMVTRVFTEFFTAFTTVLPAKFGYETRNLFMINHTIFVVLIPIMVLRLLNIANQNKWKYFILIVSVNAIFHFGYIYQLFPQTVGIILSLWIIHEFKIFMETGKKAKLIFSMLILFITYPEITPVVLLPLVISFFMIKGFNKPSIKTFVSLLGLFLLTGIVLCNYYFIDMFKFLLEQVFHGFQSNIKQGEILFPYYLNYSGFISFFGLLTTPNDFSLNTLGMSKDLIYLVLITYIFILLAVVIKGLKDFYTNNLIVFVSFTTYLMFFTFFFLLNKDFSTFKIVFLIQPYLMIALYYGLYRIKRKSLIYLILFPYILLNLTTSFKYSSMSIDNNGTMRELKGDLLNNDRSEFKNIIEELKQEKYNEKVFSTTLTNLTTEHWISYFLKNKEQIIPLLGGSIGKGKYKTIDTDIPTVAKSKRPIDYFILDNTKTILNSFTMPKTSEYEGSFFSIVSSNEIVNFIIPNRITSPYMMEASMYKEDLENFPWYLFVDETPYGKIGHLSKSSDFYIVNPTNTKSSFVMAFSGYYTNNKLEIISIYNTKTNKILYEDNVNIAFTRIISKDFIPRENQEISYKGSFVNSKMTNKNLSVSEFLNQSNPNFRNIVTSLYEFSIINEKDLNSYKAPSHITIKDMLENNLLPISGIFEDGWATKNITTQLYYDQTKQSKFTIDYDLPVRFKDQNIKLFINGVLVGNKTIKSGKHKVDFPIAISKSGLKDIQITFENLNNISDFDRRQSSLFVNSFGFNND